MTCNICVKKFTSTSSRKPLQGPWDECVHILGILPDAIVCLALPTTPFAEVLSYLVLALRVLHPVLGKRTPYEVVEGDGTSERSTLAYF